MRFEELLFCKKRCKKRLSKNKLTIKKISLIQEFVIEE